MARLNLRERVIEATIAYLGAPSESANTTFAHVIGESLGRASTVETIVDGEHRLALEWRPLEAARLNDCEMSFRIISVGSGEPLPDGASLADVDGIVLVLDSTADREPHNRRAIEAVKGALARSPEKKTVPVVVQLNQGASETAVSSSEALVAPDDWSYVVACPGKGDGVMETLKLAVGVVVDAMQTSNGLGPSTPRAPVPRTPRAEGNPLLMALRQIVQSTVTEELTGLEARLVAALEARRATDSARERAREELIAENSANEAALLDMRKLGIEDVAARLDALANDSRQMSMRMTRLEAAILEESQRATAAREQAASRVNVVKLQALVAADVTARCDALLREIRSARDDVSRTVIGATEPVSRLVERLVLRLEDIAASVEQTDANLREQST